MQTIAIVNEKGGTGKTTTAVNLAAALGEVGEKVLLVDLDGQAASSRWLGVEEDTRLADALLAGGGLDPIEDIVPGVDLAPGSGKLDSVAHDLRPTQGGQLRRVLAEVEDQYTYILIDCPPSLGNRLIGNALLAASHAIAPVEPSILALDGLAILLTTLQDIRHGFNHSIILIGALACRYDARTRLSRLVLAELNRALRGKVFETVIHETVRMQECPASGKTILDYAPDCRAAADYRALARELVAKGVLAADYETAAEDLSRQDELTQSEQTTLAEFRQAAMKMFTGSAKSPRVACGQPAEAVAPMPEVVQIPVAAEPDMDESLNVEPVEDMPAATDEMDNLTADVDDEIAGAVEQPALAAMASFAQDEPVATPVPADEAADQMSPNEDATSEPLTDHQDQQFLPQGEQQSPVQAEMETADIDPADMMIEQPEAAEDQDTPEPVPAEATRQAGGRKTVALIAATPIVLLAAAGLLAWKLATGNDASPQAAVAETALQQQATFEPAPVAQPADPMTVDAALAELDVEPADQAEPAAEPEPEQENATEGLPQPVEPTVADAAETDQPAEPADVAAQSDVDQAVADPPAEPEPEASEGEQIEYIPCPPGFRLTCIMKAPSGYLAMINGKFARVGQTISGAEVIEISVKSVEMEMNGNRFTLGIGQQSSH